MKGLSVSKGNMYDWVTHMWSPINGCPHQCSYCYVRNRFRDLSPEPNLKSQPWPDLGSGRTIFVGHLCDMWAEAVGDFMIRPVLEHCRYYSNDYVFQTKNVERILRWESELPPSRMIGTTIETNRQDILGRISKAPRAAYRSYGLSKIQGRKFLTIEPIMDFDVAVLVALVTSAGPDFVNIGADSKRHGLPEPSYAKVLQLIEALQAVGITIRKKTNLSRLESRPLAKEAS